MTQEYGMSHYSKDVSMFLVFRKPQSSVISRGTVYITHRYQVTTGTDAFSVPQSTILSFFPQVQMPSISNWVLTNNFWWRRLCVGVSAGEDG